MGILLETREPMVVSKLQDFKILPPFLTSLTPSCTQNGPKLTKNTIKHDEMMGTFFGMRKPMVI
jgi:hypothetical protein